MARKKLQYQSISKTFFVAPIVSTPINVFSSFSQPVPITKIAAHQQPQVAFEVAKIVLAVTPATLVFTKFSEPAVHSGTQNYIDVDVSNTSQVIVPPATPNFVFAQFSQPKPLQVLQEGFITSFNILSPVQPYVFSSFDQLLVGNKILHQTGHFVLPQQQTVIQTSVGPEWVDYLPRTRPQEGFITSVTFVPVVITEAADFQDWDIPFKKGYPQTDSVIFSPQPFVVIPPPVFTGFSNFGLPQQLIGTQRRQDGSSVDFRVLQPPFVPSVVQFGGWYDFGVIPKSTAFSVYEQPQVNYEILVPVILFPDFATGGGKRWQDGYKKEDNKESKVLQLQSSNLKEMSYDEDQKRLKLVFKTYEYEKVPKKKVELLSHGKYFQKHIRDQYPTTKVPPSKGKK